MMKFLTRIFSTWLHNDYCTDFVSVRKCHSYLKYKLPVTAHIRPITLP